MMNEYQPKVSIIIPVKAINDYIREAIPKHLSLDYPDFEVLVIPDEIAPEDKKESWYDNPKVRVIASGAVGPAEKRDMSLKYAKGEVFAFTDDDAFPRVDWLKNAIKGLSDPEVAAIGGPAVTAPEDDIWKLGSGKVLESRLCSGRFIYRYVPGERKEDDDIPSVNLIVKREVFESVGGYDSSYYPGEDTKLCMDIVNTGKKMIYDPDVLVYHHRRSLYKGHMKQIVNYARHRGYFAKKLPQTSARFVYFVPSFFLVGVVAGPMVCAFVPILWWFYLGTILLYFMIAAWSLRSCDSIKLFFIALLGVFLTHMGYGLFFIRGLMSKEILR